MNTFIDFELIFEIRSLQLCLANRNRYIEKNAQDQFYYKSIEEGFKQLNLQVDQVEILNHIKTVRYKIDGFQLLHSFPCNNVTLIGEIESGYYSQIIQDNCQYPYNIIKHTALSSYLSTTPSEPKVKVITSNRLFYSEIVNLNCNAELIPLTGDLTFPSIPRPQIP